MSNAHLHRVTQQALRSVAPPSNVVPMHTTQAAKAAGVRAAVFMAVERILDPTTAVIYAARAAKRYRAGECSPARAVADAIATARQSAGGAA